MAGETSLAAIHLVDYPDKHKNQDYDQNGYYHELFSFVVLSIGQLLICFECEHSIQPLDPKRNHTECFIFVVELINALSYLATTRIHFNRVRADQLLDKPRYSPRGSVGIWQVLIHIHREN